MKITIIGAGKVGLEIARRLVDEGHDLIVVDRDETKIARIHEEMDVLAFRGNGSSALTLKNCGVAESDLVVAVTNSDEINMIACLIAKRLGVPRSIARVRDPDYTADINISKEELGIDLVINPEFAAALEISRLLSVSLPVYTEPFANGRVQMAEINIEEGHYEFVNKRLQELNMPRACLIVGISRQGKMIVPGGHDKIHAGDTLYLLAHFDSVNKICTKIKKKKQRMHSVMILGGGKIGFYLAERLSTRGMGVKIIEQNEQKCRELAERLPNVLILKGDGTDVELLKREGVGETDGFVAVTGIDEENLLIALLAKQLGAKRVIAKVSRPSYAPLVERLGVDAAISPRLITISEILRFIRGGRLLSLSLLLNGQAEVVELIIPANSKVVGRSLEKLGLPKGVIVGAILRDRKIIIPQGKDIIQGNDRLVVFAVGQTVRTIEALFDVGGKDFEPQPGFAHVGPGAAV
ncbi:MAG: Trk system potassium transporter TrkA [Bacillota bacterium]